MKKIDSYLKQLQREEVLHEQGILQIFILIGQFVFLSSIYYLTSKRDKKLTKEIQGLLKTTRWKVRVLKGTKSLYNACSLSTNSVFVTQGLVRTSTHRELIAVLLHEVSHSRTLDSLSSVAVGTGSYILGFFGGLILAGTLPISGLFSYVLALTMTLVLSEIGSAAFMRQLEYKSDSFAVKYGYGDDLISAFAKIKKMWKVPKCTSIFCKLKEKIDSWFADHPEDKKRADHILKKKEFYEAAKKGPATVRRYLKGALVRG